MLVAMATSFLRRVHVICTWPFPDSTPFVSVTSGDGEGVEAVVNHVHLWEIAAMWRAAALAALPHVMCEVRVTDERALAPHAPGGVRRKPASIPTGRRGTPYCPGPPARCSTAPALRQSATGSRWPRRATRQRMADPILRIDRS